MATQFPLRQQRKAATRQKFIKSARTLFSAQGYDHTTLEQVAAHAGLHVQTLYRHFSSKHELATAGERAHLERFRDAILNPERSEDTFAFWRNWVNISATRVTRHGGEQYRDYLARREQNPLVAGQLTDIAREYEDLLTESFAKDLGVTAQGVGLPRLLATMLWGANTCVVREYQAGVGSDLVAEVVAAVDEVQALYRQTIRASG